MVFMFVLLPAAWWCWYAWTAYFYCCERQNTSAEVVSMFLLRLSYCLV